MITKINNGVQISISTSFNEKLSHIESGYYFFNYQIAIQNQTEYTIQLLNRHWYIFDSTGEKTEVQGPGVVGEQPVLESGQSFTYESGCNLQSDMGTMHGYYEFMKIIDEQKILVEIPSFNLIHPLRLN